MSINNDHFYQENKLDTYNNLPVSNPLFFLTGLKKSEEIIDQEDCSYQGIATPPCITCIVGEYGKGKTELIIQVTRFMLQSNKESKKKVLPLPINLALCRTQVEELNTLDKSNKVDSFSKLLFNHLSLPSEEIDLKFIKEELIPEIQKGNIFLLLDGLDELLSHQDNIERKHELFFDYLINFLNFNLDNTNVDQQFNIAITMRLEYLWKICQPDARDLVQNFQAKLLAPVYFLQVGFLTADNIKEYLNSITIYSDIGEIIENNPELLDILSRPLYLKLFSDLLLNCNNEKDEDFYNIIRVESIAKLFEMFIGKISKEALPSEIDHPLFKWNIEKLAKKVLEKFKNGEEEKFKDEELYDILDNLNDNNIEDEQMRLSYIHKCPFLQKFSSEEFVFSHRAFLEFFIAKAISLEIKNDEWLTFNEIVANVDMRKFLKYFAEKERNGESYDIITREGNAMTEEYKDRWKKVDGFECNENNPVWSEYEKHRLVLLNSMIFPEKSHSNLKESINFILNLNKDNEETFYIPSEYLSYAYESIAVNLRYNAFDLEYKKISEEFSSKLENKLNNHLNILMNLDDYPEIKNLIVSEKEFMLIERILDICRRLRYEWIISSIDLIQNTIDKFNDQSKETEEVFIRINELIAQVKNSMLIV
jgi:hypothetical protein